MRIDILTVVPELLQSPLNESILKRAQQKGLVEIHIHNIRDYTFDKHRQVDDYPFGGEAGMVMKPEPIFRCVEALPAERSYDEIIYTSPDGVRYDQHEANRLSTLENIVILCGHYKGIDYRVREHLITREISIGDYVLTGGELAAAAYVSERTLRNRFLRLYGKTPHQYQMERKLQGVRQMLMDFPAMPLREVAGNYGFCDEFHLSKAFKSAFGLSPAAYRRNKHEKDA